METVADKYVVECTPDAAEEFYNEFNSIFYMEDIA